MINDEEEESHHAAAAFSWEDPVQWLKIQTDRKGWADPQYSYVGENGQTTNNPPFFGKLEMFKRKGEPTFSVKLKDSKERKADACRPLAKKWMQEKCLLAFGFEPPDPEQFAV